MLIPDLFLFLPGLLIGWVIGANDAANSMGTAVGSRVRTIREAVLLVSIFGLLGAVFMGGRVAHTLGKEVIPLPSLPAMISRLIGFSAMISAGIVVLVCTRLGIPVSTSHAIVGGIIGGGLAAGLRTSIAWREAANIFLAWVLTPFLSAVIAFLSRLLSDRLGSFQGYGGKPLSPPPSLIRILLTVTGCYMAFNWGANDVANATGVLCGISKLSTFYLTLLGGAAMSCGVLMGGKRVMLTIGKKITRLTPFSALVAEFAAAVTVNLFTLAGLPVSTTHAVVGAVGGVGYGRGREAVNALVLAEIALTWFITPVFTGALSFFLFYICNLL